MQQLLFFPVICYNTKVRLDFCIGSIKRSIPDEYKKSKRKTPGAIETTSLGAMELIAGFEPATSSLPSNLDKKPVVIPGCFKGNK